MAFTHIMQGAVLMVVLSATISTASYADLSGNRNSAPVTGPNGFEAPWAMPRNLVGTTVLSGQAGSTAECESKCAAVPTAKGFNYCDAATCGTFTRGQCDCKSFEGTATFYPPDAAGYDADGWLSGPVNGGGAAPAAAAAGAAVPAAAGAAAGPVTLSADWAQKNLKGTVISTSVLPTYDECAALCTATPGCRGVNFCAGRGACGTSPQGQCDLKSFEGAAAYWADTTGAPGDGWLSKAAV